MTRVVRYAIYTRQSVDRLMDFSSCQAQCQTCHDSIMSAAESALEWCGEDFDDEDQSGATLDRPAMRRLRERVANGSIQRVYAVALDRLTRSMRDAILLMDEFEKAGVKVQFVHQPELTFGPEGRFLRHVIAAFAEFERDLFATRVAESRTQLRKHGRGLAGKVPYGYDADPDTRQLVRNRQEARRVQAIFKRAAGGELPRQIAEAINKLGWRTKVYHAKRSGRVTGGNKWTARQVVETLRNPVFLGRFAEGEGSRDGCHEAIIDQATFDAVQGQLDSRRTTSNRKRRRDDHYLLRQKIVCPRCGRFLTTYQINDEHHGVPIIRCYYACRSTAGGRPRCQGVHYSAIDIEQGVWELFGEPGVWIEMFGADGPARLAKQMAATWPKLPYPWRRGWLESAIERVELRDGDTIAVTVTRDAGSAFLTRFEAFQNPSS